MSTKRSNGFLIVALAFSLLLNVLLSRRSAEQRDYIKVLNESTRPLVSKKVDPISGVDVNGEKLQIVYDGTPTVLYVFAPGCAWCEKNLESMQALARSVQGRYRVVGVSLEKDGLPEYLRTHDLPFRVVTDLSASARNEYELGITPQTIVVGPGGVVEQNWKGAYLDDTRSEIETYFGVSVPAVANH